MLSPVFCRMKSGDRGCNVVAESQQCATAEAIAGKGRGEREAIVADKPEVDARADGVRAFVPGKVVDDIRHRHSTSVATGVVLQRVN